MNTKNIFRTLFMAVLLLVGANNTFSQTQNTVLFDNESGVELQSGTVYNLPLDGFANAKEGDIFRVWGVPFDKPAEWGAVTEHKIEVQDRAWKTVFSKTTDFNATLEYYDFTLKQSDIDRFNDTNPDLAWYGHCGRIQGEWFRLYKVEIVHGGDASGETDGSDDDSQAPKHTLTIDIDGQITPKSVAEGADLKSVLPANPTKTGHTFAGWQGMPEDGKMPAYDLTVTAVFTINSYTLTYMIDGRKYGDETYEYGATITPMGEPTLDGYTFSGWNGLPTTMPDHDVTVTGSYIKNREYVPAVVSSHGWSTFSSTRPLDFSGVSGVKAYIATRVVTGGDDDVVELVQVTGTCAAGTGLVLNGSAGTYQIPVATTNGEDYNNNLLVAVTSEATINSGNYYVLTYQNNRVAFASTAGSSAATIPAGHACLRWSQGSNARALKVVVAGETTGINAVENPLTGNEVIYNLRGQRVVNPGKGVYIINGKKVVLK